MQRMEVYNRKKGTKHDPRTGFTLRQNSVLFQPQPVETSVYLTVIAELVKEAPESIREQLHEKLKNQKAEPGISDEIKIERAKKFILVSQASEACLSEASQDSGLLNELVTSGAKVLQQFKKHVEENEPGFEYTLAKTMGAAAVSNLASSYLPAGALLLALIPVAAAQYAPSDLKVYGGNPPGGLNMCGGNIYCRSAYIAPINDPNHFLGQISTTMSSATGDGIDLAFLDCCNPSKLGEAVKYLYANSTQGGGLTCFANSIIYRGTQASAQGTNLPIPDCNKFTQAVNPVFNECVNYSSSVGMWIGVGFGCAAALAILVTLTVVCCAKNDCKPRCC